MGRFYVLVCFLLSAFFVLALIPTPGRAAPEEPPEGWTGIYQRSDLEQISLFPDGRYLLMNDIDLTGEPWTGLCSEDIPFTGMLDGNGFTVYGMEVSSQSSACGLFTYLDGATVTDLTVSGQASGPMAGLLAGKMNGGSVSGCRGEGTVTASFCGGGLIGQVSGTGATISDCTAAGNFSLTLSGETPLPPEPETAEGDSEDPESSVTERAGEPEGFLGGLVGSVIGEELSLTSCETSGSLSFLGGRGSVGGIVGALDGSAAVTSCGTEAALSLSPTVYASVGGTAGRAGKGTALFSQCFFRGEWAVASCDAALDMGGIVGNLYAISDVTVESCVSYGSLSSFAASSSLGGTVGSSVGAEGSVTVRRCTSFVSLSGGNAPLYLGGICGENRGEGGTATVINCHAGGKISHSEAPVRDPSLAFGGICGVNGGEGRSVIELCFSSCDLDIFYPLAEGAVVGLNAPAAEGAEATVTRCYYRAGATEYFATPISGAALSDPLAYAGFDFESVWQMDGSTGMPLLRPGKASSDTPLAGDVDGNGKITEYDGRLLMQYLTGRVLLSDGQLQRSDTNSDGSINAGDVSLILRNAT